MAGADDRCSGDGPVAVGLAKKSGFGGSCSASLLGSLPSTGRLIGVGGRVLTAVLMKGRSFQVNEIIELSSNPGSRSLCQRPRRAQGSAGCGAGGGARERAGVDARGGCEARRPRGSGAKPCSVARELWARAVLRAERTQSRAMPAVEDDRSVDRWVDSGSAPPGASALIEKPYREFFARSSLSFKL